VWQDKPYDLKSDIWSVGCVIYEMCTLKPPFHAADMQGLYKAVCNGVVANLPNFYSKDLNYMVKSLLQVKPQLRPTCSETLNKS
jgi:NIMA (never in mitosis gene a)-related kinase